VLRGGERLRSGWVTRIRALIHTTIHAGTGVARSNDPSHQRDEAAEMRLLCAAGPSQRDEAGDLLGAGDPGKPSRKSITAASRKEPSHHSCLLERGEQHHHRGGTSRMRKMDSRLGS